MTPNTPMKITVQMISSIQCSSCWACEIWVTPVVRLSLIHARATGQIVHLGRVRGGSGLNHQCDGAVAGHARLVFIMLFIVSTSSTNTDRARPLAGGLRHPDRSRHCHRARPCPCVASRIVGHCSAATRGAAPSMRGWTQV